MEDLQSRRLEALSAHVEGLKAAVGSQEAEGSRDSLRRILRSLAQAADDLDLPDIAGRAREARARTDGALSTAARDLLTFLVALRPAEAPGPEHVLVVANDPTVASALMACLRQPDRVLHLAGTAARAEEMLAAHPIDLVILELFLPDRDGRDLLLQLREEPATAHLPIIVLSAGATPRTRAECLAVGARDFLEKPADPTVVRQMVALRLSNRDRDQDARLDPTTGILSRAGLTESYRALRSRTGRVAGPLAVAVLAIEPFERIRGALGREAADHLVKTVAAHLSASLDPRDELGRWSEAELLALLPSTSSTEARSRLEEGLSGLIAAGLVDHHVRSGLTVLFTAGVAVADSGADLREAAFAAERWAQRGRREGSRITFAPPPAEPAGPPRVLLVEDDRVTATLIQHRLVREGFDVMDFLNGEDAFRWASTGSFDVAILDVNVPGMHGFEILERLRAVPKHAEVPIILVTGLGSEADVVQGLDLGANDYMLKPFSPSELLARVRRLAAEPRDSEPSPALEGTRGTASGAEAG